MSRSVIIQKGDKAFMLRVSAHIARLDPKYAWRVEVKRYVKRRTTEQNSLMWAWVNEVVDIIREHTGMDSDDLHEFFKRKFLPAAGRTLVEFNGESFERFTTTALNVHEMTEYLERIEAFCADNFDLDLPNRQRLNAA